MWTTVRPRQRQSRLFFISEGLAGGESKYSRLERLAGVRLVTQTRAGMLEEHVKLVIEARSFQSFPMSTRKSVWTRSSLPSMQEESCIMVQSTFGRLPKSRHPWKYEELFSSARKATWRCMTSVVAKREGSTPPHLLHELKWVRQTRGSLKSLEPNPIFFFSPAHFCAPR
jgi:hypothetical protein